MLKSMVTRRRTRGITVTTMKTKLASAHVVMTETITATRTPTPLTMILKNTVLLSSLSSISTLVQHVRCIQIKHTQLYKHYNHRHHHHHNHRHRHYSSYTCSVEWNPQFLSSSTSSSSSLDALVDNVDYFVLPDLPTKYSPDDRTNFYTTIPIDKQMTTIATCCHTTKESLLYKITESSASTSINHKSHQGNIHQRRRLLLVSGNDKNQSPTGKPVLSSIDAARTLLSREAPPQEQQCYKNDDDSSSHKQSTNNNNGNKLEVWSVINPNDPNSIEHIHNKINVGGITNFITQPFLSSNATHIFNRYPTTTKKSTSFDTNTTKSTHIRYIIGMAMPQTSKNLLYWIQLLDQPELVHDPLFQRHVEYFSTTSLFENTTTTAASNISSSHDGDNDIDKKSKMLLKLSKMSEWIQNEISYITRHCTTDDIDGFHFMPINKVNDKLDSLIHIIQQLKKEK